MSATEDDITRRQEGDLNLRDLEEEAAIIAGIEHAVLEREAAEEAALEEAAEAITTPVELELIRDYENVSSATNTINGVQNDNFNSLKDIIITNELDSSGAVNEYLEPYIDIYMTQRYQGLLQYAQTNRGLWKLRRFLVPATELATLQERNIPFIIKEDTNPAMLEVKGVPDGFYSAWKTICRAIDNEVEIAPRSKTEIDRAIRELRSPPSADTLFTRACTTLGTAIIALRNEYSAEEVVSKLHDLISDLSGEIDDIETADNDTTTPGDTATRPANQEPEEEEQHNNPANTGSGDPEIREGGPVGIND